MKSLFLAVLMLGAVPSALAAQAPLTAISQTIDGTRLDISATGEVSRVPDVAVISAGVVSRSATASGALQETASRMNRVLASLRGAGLSERDIQTNNISLNPEYRYESNQAPQLVGYTASNTVTVRFRDIRSSGKILDALVAQGANQINGPTLVIDKPEAALDEARAKAIAAARARAELYARAMNLRVVRIVSASESGGYSVPPPVPMMMAARASKVDTSVEPGEQKLEVNVAMTFELK